MIKPSQWFRPLDPHFERFALWYWPWSFLSIMGRKREWRDIEEQARYAVDRGLPIYPFMLALFALMPIAGFLGSLEIWIWPVFVLSFAAAPAGARLRHVVHRTLETNRSDLRIGARRLRSSLQYPVLSALGVMLLLYMSPVILGVGIYFTGVQLLGLPNSLAP